MDLEPNKGKQLVIEVNGRRFARYPVKTKLITNDDKDIVNIAVESVGKRVKPGDIVFISEKVVAITQGRAYPVKTIKPSWLANFLSRFITKTSIGIGLGSPETMELAIEEVGVARILLASLVGALGKILGIKGLFYIVAGHQARSVDGPVPYAIPPYNTYVSKGPLWPNETAQKISEIMGVSVAIVDANDIGVNVLGASTGVDKKLIVRIIKDNPLGQTNEQTPIGIIREIHDIRYFSQNFTRIDKKI